MKSSFRPVTAAAAAALVLAAGAGAAAYAQAPAPQPAPKAGEASPGRHLGHGRHHGQRRAELVRQALNLRPDQQAAWERYQAALRPNPAQRQARREQRRALASMTTPQRLDAIQARMRQRQERFERRAQATRQFYAALDAEQQRTFDAVTQMGGGKGGFGRGHGGHRMRRGGGSQGPAQG